MRRRPGATPPLGKVLFQAADLPALDGSHPACASGTDKDSSAPGITFADMKNLMYSDIQYGASLVKPQLVTMCKSFPGGLAPISTGCTIAAGSACRVLAA